MFFWHTVAAVHEVDRSVKSHVCVAALHAYDAQAVVVGHTFLGAAKQYRRGFPGVLGSPVVTAVLQSACRVAFAMDEHAMFPPTLTASVIHVFAVQKVSYTVQGLEEQAEH